MCDEQKSDVCVGWEQTRTAERNALLARAVKAEERCSELAGFLDDCTDELKQTRALLRELLADVYEVLEDGRWQLSGPPHLKLCQRVDAYLNPKSPAPDEDDDPDDQGDADDDPGSDPPLGGLGCVENEEPKGGGQRG